MLLTDYEDPDKDDGLTPEQREEREAQAIREESYHDELA